MSGNPSLRNFILLKLNYFSFSEFACPCGTCDIDGSKMSIQLLKALDYVREVVGHPITITRGHVCTNFNQKQEHSPTSSHLEGLAADINLSSSRDRYLALVALGGWGITRIGIGQNFLHLDIDRDKPQNLIWTYY